MNCKVCGIPNKSGRKGRHRHQAQERIKPSVRSQRSRHTQSIVGIFPWLLVQHQLHHQRRITDIPQGQRVILQAACSLPKHRFFQLLHPACFRKRRYLVYSAEQRARQTGWPPLYNWRPYKYILQRPPLSHCTVSALQHWNYLSPNARTDQ